MTVVNLRRAIQGLPLSNLTLYVFTIWNLSAHAQPRKTDLKCSAILLRSLSPNELNSSLPDYSDARAAQEHLYALVEKNRGNPDGYFNDDFVEAIDKIIRIYAKIDASGRNVSGNVLAWTKTLLEEYQLVMHRVSLSETSRETIIKYQESLLEELGKPTVPLTPKDHLLVAKDSDRDIIKKLLGPELLQKIPPEQRKAIQNVIRAFQSAGGVIELNSEIEASADFGYTPSGLPRIRLNTDHFSNDVVASFVHELDHFSRSERWVRRLAKSSDPQALASSRLKLFLSHPNMILHLEENATQAEREVANFILQQEHEIFEKRREKESAALGLSEVFHNQKLTLLKGADLRAKTYPQTEALAWLILTPPKGVPHRIIFYRQNVLMDSLLGTMLLNSGPLPEKIDYKTLKAAVFNKWFSRLRTSDPNGRREGRKLSGNDMLELEKIFLARMYIMENHRLDPGAFDLARIYFNDRSSRALKAE